MREKYVVKIVGSQKLYNASYHHKTDKIIFRLYNMKIKGFDKFVDEFVRVDAHERMHREFEYQRRLKKDYKPEQNIVEALWEEVAVISFCEDMNIKDAKNSLMTSAFIRNEMYCRLDKFNDLCIKFYQKRMKYYHKLWLLSMFFFWVVVILWVNK